MESPQPGTHPSILELNTLITCLHDKFQNLIFFDDVEDTAIVQALNSLVVFKNLTNDIYALLQLPTEDMRQQFLAQKSYIKYFAQPVYSKTINAEWFFKTLEIGIECLRELDSMDLRDRPSVLLLFGRFRAMIIMYPYAITFSQDDLFSYDITSEKWNEVRRFAKKKVLASPQKIEKEIKRLATGIQIATAMSYHNVGVRNQLLRTLNIVFTAPYYLMNEQHRTNKNTLFKSGIDVNRAKELWNFTESGVAKYLVKFALPSIEYMRKIHLSGRAYPMVTEQAILKWMKGETKKLELEPAPRDQEMTKQNIFCEYSNRICVRVLCNRNLERMEGLYQTNPDDFSTIIFHVHGGGFISLSSRTHQTYSRKWANKCGAPVFSVDYRKAPENPYPDGLADVWQVYNWLLNESHKFFKIKKDKRIIVAGDSAGGNLIFSLTNLCIENGVRPPNTIVAFYPAVNLSLKCFTPSLLYSFSDPLLSFEFLLICVQSYITKTGFSPESDYFISPLFTPNQVITMYPPVKIFIGDKDPLYDDAIRFALKIQRNKVPIQVTVYENMVHAFLSMDVPGGVTEAAECVKDSIQILAELVASNQL